MSQRVRPPWEAKVISVCIMSVVVVTTVCIIIFIIYLAIFGAATLRNHTP